MSLVQIKIKLGLLTVYVNDYGSSAISLPYHQEQRHKFTLSLETAPSVYLITRNSAISLPYH